MDLVNIEKDLEVLKTRGSGELDDDIEECRRHIEMIIELSKDIKDSSHYDVRKVFAKVGEQLQDELTLIRKVELRINS